MPDCDESLCAGCTLADDYEPIEFDGVPLTGEAVGEWITSPSLLSKLDDALLNGSGDRNPVGFLMQPTARETHMPWFCSECAVSRCSAWTPEGGGRCCWCGVWLAMP